MPGPSVSPSGPPSQVLELVLVRARLVPMLRPECNQEVSQTQCHAVGTLQRPLW